MSGLNNGSSGLFSGVSGLAIATGAGLYNDWAGLSGGGNEPPPVNTIPPTVGGDLYEGGTVTIVPGTWTDADSYRYRLIKGDAVEPDSPVVEFTAWSAATSGTASGIADGDYMWAQEEATGPGGVTIATSLAGHGPMEELVPTDASIIGTAGLDTTSVTASTVYSFDMTITDTPRRQLFVALQLQQGTGTVETPAWSDVKAEGVSLTLVEAFSLSDGASRHVYTEIWGLAGGTVPVGAGVTIEATRPATTTTMRSQLAAVAVGNTGASLATAADTAQQTTTTDATNYTWNVTTSVAKRLVIAFVGGAYLSTPAAGTATFTDNGTSWTTSLKPWDDSSPITKSASAVGWLGALSRAIATASTVSVGFLRSDTQRYGLVTTIILPGDNS
jgi:hypothetical protein